MTDEERKAMLDAMLHGIGATKNGKHIPHEDLYFSAAEAERKALVERLRQGHEGPAANQIEADGQRIAELEAALLFYANNKNYRYIIQSGCSEVDIDAGETAREALGETK